MKIPHVVLLCGLALACGAAIAQPDYVLHATPVGPAPATRPLPGRSSHPARQIEQTIKTLVGFGTRSTLSSMETDLPPGQGINAAADWIAGQFDADFARMRRLPRSPPRHITADPASGGAVGPPHSQAHHHHQHLRHSARDRPGSGQAHGPGHRPLRLAQHQRSATRTAPLPAPTTMPPAWPFRSSAPAP